ncbi:STAS domain-containing protein [Mycolicibacterium sp. P1-18]|uniref:STAS domain-containing protein n=1 Tax=Mycolicibacterium sp. P1-18 TaxID=2024615 RepID=UPI001566DEFE|nr:STAS domain-containing protein [Mycolicibacterium sp. P1-18]
MTVDSSSGAPEDPRADAIRRIAAASEVIASVTTTWPVDEIVAAKADLALAVGAARDLAVSWQAVGDALGMRRGNAYQRFRQRPASRMFAIHESPIDGVTVLTLRGDLDAVTVPQLSGATHRTLGEVETGVIVDLEELTFLSSAGMGALVAGHRGARLQGKRFGVVTNSAISKRPITLLGIDQTLNLYATVHEAMLGLHRPAGDPPVD